MFARGFNILFCRQSTRGVGLVLSAALVLSACGGASELDRPDPNKIASGPNVSGPREGVYLRASFDDDPSMFIGRFVSDNVAAADVDENRAVQTMCSQFIKYKEVRAAGEFNEYYQSSQSVKASLGIDSSAAGLAGTPSGNVGVSNERGTEVRVEYKLTRKLVAHIEDHAGFTSCCESAAGACSGQYIGEFWLGTGTLYQMAGRATGVDAGGTAGPKVKGVGYQSEAGLEVADGWSWRRAMSFDEVYFAFRVMDAEISGCAWADRPPRSDLGHYFVGVSPPAGTEDIARNFAMRHARTQVVNFLGEYIATQTMSRSSLKGYLEDEAIVASAAEGLASRVKDERYCPAERLDTPDGSMYLVKVLAFFPDADARAGAQEIVRAVSEKTGETAELKELSKELEGGQK
ncbi:MAG: hypothetical protein H0U74_16035 [Bradymonadaceae bacterium]|nr:hypothetical protein [Lujinxingiaceae bacterium]